MTFAEIRSNSGEQNEAFVHSVYPLAYLHGHGPECTILAATHGNYPPELIATHSYTLGRTIRIDPAAPREKQKVAEDYLWRVAASIVLGRLQDQTV